MSFSEVKLANEIKKKKRWRQGARKALKSELCKKKKKPKKTQEGVVERDVENRRKQRRRGEGRGYNKESWLKGSHRNGDGE